MPLDFKEAIEQRRSIYGISDESTITAEEIMEIVDHSTKHVPSAFNCQSQRVAVLFGEKHLEFWSIVMETLRKKFWLMNFGLLKIGSAALPQDVEHCCFMMIRLLLKV